jgi:general secretion pathway protein C
MKHLFKPDNLKTITFFLMLLLIVKLIWFVVEILWLSPFGINQEEESSVKSLYYRIKLTPNSMKIPPKKIKKQPKEVQKNIKDIKLLAIYNASDIAVVTVEYKQKFKVLGKGDSINGFTLEKAGSNFAIFTKKETEYKLMLLKNKKMLTTKSSINIVSPSIVNKNKLEEEVVYDGEVRIIDRALLEHYAKNEKEIYKNIGISEIKEGTEVKGFKINFVRKDSIFEKLGVHRNDIIKKVNGQEITNYNAAFSVYKNIDKAENISLVIQRGKEEMELEYEIN